ncbi:hypothetical protein OHV05_37825 (plasmid) [Kitasatospora sp. NBC_00070]|uniref:hypothetical protein n=1 Tax=Kitasatospora sp. NBC_00070 TaxID=2975962 RepID=UPI002F909FBB
MSRRLQRRVAAAFLKLAEGLMVQSNGLVSVTSAVDGFGGFDAQYEQIGKVSAHHGDNWEVLVHVHLKADPAVMLNLLESLDLVATSEDSRPPGVMEYVNATLQPFQQMFLPMRAACREAAHRATLFEGRAPGNASPFRRGPIHCRIRLV